MALVPQSMKPACSSAIEAKLFLLFHTSELSERFQGTLHVGKIVQTVAIEKMSQVTTTSSITASYWPAPEIIKRYSYSWLVQQSQANSQYTVVVTFFQLLM
jgi:GTPase